MSIRTWTRRAAVAGCGTAVVALVIAPAASAQTESTQGSAQPAPITLSPEESAQLCDEMLPRLQKRTDRALERISGGPATPGSAEFLRERAKNQRDKGHPQIADRLDKRAERRAGRLDDLTRIKQRLADFGAKHCQAAGGTK